MADEIEQGKSEIEQAPSEVGEAQSIEDTHLESRVVFLPPAIQFKRQITTFHSQEMLFDYVLDRLDPERRAALDEALTLDKELRSSLESTQKGLDYAKLLQRTDIHPEIIAQLKDAESPVSLGRRYSSWKSWPDTVRWSFIAIFVSASVALTVANVPWKKLPWMHQKSSDLVELAQIPQSPSVEGAESADPEVQALADGRLGQARGRGNVLPGLATDEPNTEIAGEVDLGDAAAISVSKAGSDLSDNRRSEADSHTDSEIDSKKGVTVAGQKSRFNSDQERLRDSKLHLLPMTGTGPGAAKTAQANALSMSPSSLQVASNSSRAQSQAASQLNPRVASEPRLAGEASQRTLTQGATKVEDWVSSEESADATARGFVYRAFMTLSDLDELGPKIASSIRDLGGEKAGEVELGWRRGSGRYYHFSLPKVNEKRIIDRLQVYGPVRISKDPHPRVMPEGQVRFILWIESAK